VIRIDDVVCQEPALDWLLDLLASRGMCASLEVVPYLRQIDEAFLHHLDPAASLFEVSQHGYAHLPRTSDSGRRCEFSLESAEPTAEERDDIARGKTQLEKEFPKRFSGGFSPPFDALPSWLPATWRELGGAFVSCLHTNSVPGAPLRVARAGVDVWDWNADRALNRDVLARKLAVQLALDGHTGIVLHPRCLRDRPNKSRLLSLLNYLEEEGAATVSLKDLALGKVEPAPASARINPLRRSFVGKK
jgi:peptidoglycan/xylan/chitin deacetylase (PgdA/CDA1 family)